MELDRLTLRQRGARRGERRLRLCPATEQQCGQDGSEHEDTGTPAVRDRIAVHGDLCRDRRLPDTGTLRGDLVAMIKLYRQFFLTLIDNVLLPAAGVRPSPASEATVPPAPRSA